MIPGFPRDEIEAARYYLSPTIAVELAGERSGTATPEPATTYDAYCLAKSRDERPDPDAQRFPRASCNEAPSRSSDGLRMAVGLAELRSTTTA